MSGSRPRITLCIPHWQVKDYITVCLRSICKHSEKYNLEVIVVDNGSRDNSLDYLRSLDWIRLIERPEEKHTNWPGNVFTAWNRGLKDATGEYFVTMHSDVFIKRDDWLDPFLREIERHPQIAASGSGKLVIEHPLYSWQKRVVGYVNGSIKSLLGRKKSISWNEKPYPRDYCAVYCRDVLLQHNLTFECLDHRGGGYSIATQLWNAGYQMGMFPVREMAEKLVHIAHGTAAAVPEKPLNHRQAQIKVERKMKTLFEEDWINELKTEEALDSVRPAA
jgi:glycosyltransferase involved in cell wall biosynthesis